jgi:hypothetical protein
VEAFGIALVLVGGLVAAPIFCLALAKMVRPFPRVAFLAFWIAVPLVLLYASEVLLVLTRGVLFTRALIGPSYFLIHVLLTFSAAPAFACVLILGRRSLSTWWPLVAAICWLVGAGSVFYQYDVAETLYGIDGQGGPYQQPW